MTLYWLLLMLSTHKHMLLLRLSLSRPPALHTSVTLNKTVSKQQQTEASEARRWADEASGLKGEVTKLQQELADAKDQLHQLQHTQSSSGRRVVELEGDAAQLSQQLTVSEWCWRHCLIVSILQQVARAFSSACTQASSPCVFNCLLQRLTFCHVVAPQPSHALPFCPAGQAANERAAMLEAQNKRLNDDLSAAETSHNRLTQQLGHADLQNSKLSQQLASTEAQQSRFEQQVSAAEAHNAKLLQQLSAADGEVSALRSEVTLLQSSRQQLDATCEQLRQLQQDAQRHMAQLTGEVTQASQEIMVRLGWDAHTYTSTQVDRC